MKDHEIIDLYWSRNEAPITATADTDGNYCYCIAYNILCNHEDAEKCVNDAWLDPWKSIPPHRASRLSTHLGKITRNLSLNRYKLLTAKKRGMGQVALSLSEPEGCVPSRTDMEQIADALAPVNAIETFLRTQSRIERLHRTVLVSVPLGIPSAKAGIGTKLQREIRKNICLCNADDRY